MHNLVGKHQRRDNFEDLYIDGSIVLKLALHKHKSEKVGGIKLVRNKIQRRIFENVAQNFVFRKKKWNALTN
jgi:hypothetical protein